MGKRETLDVLVRHKLIRQGIADFCTHEPREPVLDIHEVARRLAALERVVPFARHADGCGCECCPCKCGLSTALAALDGEVG